MNDVVVSSRAVLSHHAKSFRWASWFLPPDRRDDAAVVYALCRLIDDIADEAVNASHAMRDLEALKQELMRQTVARPLVNAFLDVADRTDMDIAYALELLEGVLSDLGDVRVGDGNELLRYCYRVAGTVGLMMCSVLGVTDPRARAHAIDLGVGMQMTNICRDVLEDARIGRVYLPADLLARHGISQDRIVKGTVNRQALATVVRQILAKAESYYESADYGMRFIPRRSRLAILVASRLYRAIGVKLVDRFGGDAFHGRTFVTGVEKTFLVVGASFAFLKPKMMSRFEAKHRHDAQLHLPLNGMPGANSAH